MKLLHIGDLHIGKRVNEFNLMEDQIYILNQIIDIAGKEKPDAILIAGDVYDKSQPSAEAVVLLDNFLTKLTALSLPVFVISGNHDSPERLSFGNQLLLKNNLYIAGVFDGTLHTVTLQDEYGDVNIHLLPFIKPAMLRPYFEKTAETYDEAIRMVLSSASIDRTKRNVLVAHQFITNLGISPERSDSENISVGGLDQIDVSAFEDFDYIALGHLHGPQKIQRDSVRYCGSPLKYSFSETHHKKSITKIELKQKGELSIELLRLSPLRDMREMKGPLKELLAVGREDNKNSNDFIHATLTDEETLFDPIGQLREVYPNLMILDFDNPKKRQSNSLSQPSKSIADRSPFDLFEEFYLLQNNIDITESQKNILTKLFQQVGEETI